MKSIKKVGRLYVSRRKPYEKKKWRYQDCEMDYDKWVIASKYLPADYDLCLLRIGDKILPGWSIGTKWDGKQIDEDAPVTHWKKKDFSTEIMNA
jgi:hypothetical protein